MSEKIKERAREEAARILGTLPGCTTCVEGACTIARLTRERDETRRQVEEVTEALRLVSNALDRLNQIYRADADLGDPPVETPAWLREAQHRAAALLTPTTNP